MSARLLIGSPACVCERLDCVFERADVVRDFADIVVNRRAPALRVQLEEQQVGQR